MFRNVAPRKLIVAAAVIMILQTAVTVSEWYGYREASVAAARGAGSPQLGQGADRSTEPGDREPSRGSTRSSNRRATTSRKTVSRVRKSYVSALGVVAPKSWYYETTFFLQHGLLECLGMMLLGMALLKYGVLTGAASRRVYATMAARRLRDRPARSTCSRPPT